MNEGGRLELDNDAYQLIVDCTNEMVQLTITDRKASFDYCSGQYLYRVVQVEKDHQIIHTGLTKAQVKKNNESLVIQGEIAGLHLEHHFNLPAGRPILEETITVTNPMDHAVELVDFVCGACCLVTDSVGKIKPDFQSDRFQAIPFYRHPTDPTDQDHDYEIQSILRYFGREPRVNELAAIPEGHGFVPSDKRYSDGWAWQHGTTTLGIYKFNQDFMEFSVLGVEITPDGVAIRFGGAGMLEKEPSSEEQFNPLLPFGGR